MTEKRRRVLALWRGVFGEPPPVEAEPELLIRLLVEHLPHPPPYGAPRVPYDVPAESGRACETLSDLGAPGLR